MGIVLCPLSSLPSCSFVPHPPNRLRVSPALWKAPATCSQRVALGHPFPAPGRVPCSPQPHLQCSPSCAAHSRSGASGNRPPRPWPGVRAVGPEPRPLPGSPCCEGCGPPARHPPARHPPARHAPPGAAACACGRLSVSWVAFLFRTSCSPLVSLTALLSGVLTLRVAGGGVSFV